MLRNLIHVSTIQPLRLGLLTFSSVRISVGSQVRDAEYDDLGAWSRLKRNLTRRWTSQIGTVEDVSPSTISLEEGGAEGGLAEEKTKGATNIEQVQGRDDLSSRMLEIPVSQTTFMKLDAVSSRPSSAGRASSKGSGNRNSGVMVEEEPPTWLRQYGTQ